MSLRKSTIRGPISRKRRLIRKKYYFSGSAALIAAGYTATMDTIEEEETLVRIVGNLNITPLVANPGLVHAWIVMAPSASALLSPEVATQSVDGRDAKSILWTKVFQSSNDSANADPFIFDIDVKGMRKLSKGDTLLLKVDTDADAKYTIAIGVSLFYKKA